MKIRKLERAKLNNNALKEVIAQIKFPRNMQIESGLPAEFQKQMSPNFPIFELQQSQEVTFKLPGKNDSGGVHETQVAVYNFKSADGFNKISLSRDFLAVSTSKYDSWDAFFSILENSYNSLMEIYTIPLILRVGLRYRNLIDKTALFQDETSWSDILKPNVLGHIATDSLFEGTLKESSLKGSRSITQIKLENYSLNIQTGFADIGKGKLGFFIDNDFFDNIKIAKDKFNLDAKMRELHADSESTFRHFLTDKLYTVLLGAKE